MTAAVLALSTLLQFMAALAATVMIRRTGAPIGWIALASALVLMAVRRAFTLYRIVVEGEVVALDAPTEIVALVISVLMLLGVVRLGQIVLGAQRTEAALRESDERFRTVVNHSPTKIHIKDRDGHYLLLNHEAEELFGVTDEEARGRTSLDIFSPEQAEAFRTHDRAVLENGRALEAEEEFVRADGVHTFLTVKFPIRDGDGKIVAIGAIGTDITERKHVEAQLRAAKDEAELANRAKSEFLASVSHELRTPLNAVIGFSELIEGETFGPLGKPVYVEYAQYIRESGQHLLELINDILDLSKIESGTDELNETTVEIDELVGSVLTLVGSRAENQGLTIAVDIPTDLPALDADPRKLKQILVNLLSNAVKFTAPGGGVTLSCRCAAD
ncbi:MAG TPA: PAS domain-containing protein, partial [Kiloniellales bacterium]|nr:PAS domain-containing protein [Kiloniellales bacterium]